MKRNICLLLLICCSLNLFAQTEKKWPSALLWRISGNGLTEPSYLYGTIHLKDKELFFFGDSLYSALNRVKGFALEVDPEENMTPFIQQMMGGNLLDDDEEEEEETIPNNKKDKKKSPPKISGLKVFDYEYLQKKKDRMNINVDGYLFYLAKQKGKWLGGLEDLTDHIKQVDELGRNIEHREEDTATLAFNRGILKQWYRNHSLDKIHQAFSGSLINDREFINRNLKMAHRADSLSRIRTMFYAVGCAHLPGDSGVITLLRQKGYTLTPVFSSTIVFPVALSEQFDQWKTIWAADSSHQFRMPVTPTEVTPKGINMVMHIAYDLPSRFVYFLSSVTYPGEYRADLLKSIINKEDKKEKYKNVKWFTHQGYPAVSGKIRQNAADLSFRFIQNKNTLYMLLAGAEEDEFFNEKYASSFFNSFQILKNPEAPKQTLTTVTDTTLGFSATCSCILAKKKTTDADEKNRQDGYSCVDIQTQSHYEIYALSMKPGYYNSTDSAFLSSYLGELVPLAGNNPVTNRRFLYDGYPAAHYSFTSEDQKHTYNILFIIKGNIRYIISVTKMASDTSENNFLSSFRFNSIPKSNWAWQTHPDNNLRIYMPGAFILKSDTDEPANTKDTLANEPWKYDYLAYDTETATTYYLFKTINSPYHWFSSDSAWMNTLVRNQENAGDSVISKKLFYQNGVPVCEILNACNMQNTVHHVKFMLTGDTLYEIQSYITLQQLASPQHQKLYDSVFVLKPAPLTYFTNKAEKLLSTLLSEDSTQRQLAVSALDEVLFTKKDLPLLHQVLIKKHPGDSGTRGYGTVGYKLTDIIKTLADSTTTDFIINNYHQVPDDAATGKSDFLYLLAEQKTASSAAILKKLLLEQPPTAHGHFNFTNAISDTLQLAAQLFPEINRLITDTISGLAVASLLNQLSDSNLVPLSYITGAETAINHLAENSLKQYKTNPDDYFGNRAELVHLLAKIKTPASLKLFGEFGKLKNEYICYNVLETSAKNGLPVNPATLQLLASSKYYRADAYRVLKKYRLEKMFPAAYSTQKSMAETLLFNYISEYHETEPEKMQFVKELTAPYKGKTYRFIVYKMLINMDDELVWYTGFSGPFEMNTRKLLQETEAAGSEWIDFESAFSLKDIPKKFKQYLEQLSEGE